MKKIVLIFGFCLYGLGYSNVVQPIAFFVSNDNLSFPFSDAAQTATANVLTNDTVNGVAFTPPAVGVTVAQVSSSNAGVSINPQGFITVAGGTPAGSYTLVYNFTTPCGVSNNATVTVSVNPLATIYHHGYAIAPDICTQAETQVTLSPLVTYINNEVNWSGIDGRLIVNGIHVETLDGSPVPIVYLLNEDQFNYPGLPPGFTLNQNGSLTIAPNTTLPEANNIGEYPDQQYGFYMKICEAANLNNCSEPILVTGNLYPAIRAGYDKLIMDSNGNVCQHYDLDGSPNTMPDWCGSYNILERARLCIEQATTSNVNVTFLSSTNSEWEIDELAGIIQYSGFYPITTTASPIVLDYLLSEIGNPSVSVEGQVEITVLTSLPARMANPKNIKVISNSTNNFLIYPNPSTDGFFNLEFFESSQTNIKIEVFNSIGQMVFNNHYYDVDNELQLNLTHLAKGIYLLKAYNNQEVFDAKIIIE